MSDFLGGLFGDEKSQGTQDQKNQYSSSQGNDASSGSQGNGASSSSQGNTASQSAIGNQTEGSLELHKEELDITKNNVSAGEVVLSKEVVEEQKTVDVPVMHEEVVIKRTPVNQRSNASITSEETVHIPVSEEQVEVNKYTVTTEEISASKRQVEETQQVQETLKHEEAHVNTTGSVDIVEGGSGFEDINKG
ncbi:YsnF/AvaK domain-containing protein [Mesobacillus foraminis]|uniref:YsnF/AvaK domain-containing protein n=1 Tax=Mesobacillus foraminis TaxID=279826 RepID=UPI001BE9F975|nr:YsnF/AvaK domain-containing protein [Mesobacillus foraminis]MBT2758472.1 YsnF/AvaK domain-containing protein [Mesobacillus foraminis]